MDDIPRNAADKYGSGLGLWLWLRLGLEYFQLFVFCNSEEMAKIGVHLPQLNWQKKRASFFENPVSIVGLCVDRQVWTQGIPRTISGGMTFNNVQ